MHLIEQELSLAGAHLKLKYMYMYMYMHKILSVLQYTMVADAAKILSCEVFCCIRSLIFSFFFFSLM